MHTQFNMATTTTDIIRIDLVTPPPSPYLSEEGGVLFIDLVTPPPSPVYDPFDAGHDIMKDLYEGGLKDIIRYWEAEQEM